MSSLGLSASPPALKPHGAEPVHAEDLRLETTLILALIGATEGWCQEQHKCVITTLVSLDEKTTVVLTQASHWFQETELFWRQKETEYTQTVLYATYGTYSQYPFAARSPPLAVGLAETPQQVSAEGETQVFAFQRKWDKLFSSESFHS